MGAGLLAAMHCHSPCATGSLPAPRGGTSLVALGGFAWSWRGSSPTTCGNQASGCVKCCHEGMIRKIAALLHRRHHPAPSHPVAGELGWAAERWSHQTGNILHFPSSPGSTFECVTVIVAACSFFLVQHEPVLTSEEQKHQRAM